MLEARLVKFAPQLHPAQTVARPSNRTTWLFLVARECCYSFDNSVLGKSLFLFAPLCGVCGCSPSSANQNCLYTLPRCVKLATMSSNQDVFLLPLTDSGAPDVPREYVYLPPPRNPAYVLRIAIEGTSPLCNQGTLWANIPAEGEDFRRSKYVEYKYVESSIR